MPFPTRVGVQCEPFENIIPPGVILNGAVFQAQGRIWRAGHHVWGKLPRGIPLPTE